MNPFLDEILGQPHSLRQFAAVYENQKLLLAQVSIPHELVLTGMGASFHALSAMSLYFHSLGIWAPAVEATELFLYGQALLKSDRDFLYVSQSGSSPEVGPLLTQRQGQGLFIAVTNFMDSPLAHNARYVLPLLADHETTVATKTYINTLACLWLLARRWTGQLAEKDFATLKRLADEIQTILDRSEEITGRWLEAFARLRTLIFTGYGPQAATSRQAAQTVAEWAKIPVIGTSAGALRHGLIEIVGPDSGVIVFASPGQSYAMSLALAEDLQAYGARVLLVQSGQTRRIGEPETNPFVWDEFLSTILDVIPSQLYAEALARHLGLQPGFRYLTKVVSKL